MPAQPRYSGQLLRNVKISLEQREKKQRLARLFDRPFPCLSDPYPLDLASESFAGLCFSSLVFYGCLYYKWWGAGVRTRRPFWSPTLRLFV